MKENKKNNVKLLPVKDGVSLSFPYFPSRMHAAIFRLWETVKAERIADGLGLSYETVLKAAEDMGLPQQKNMENWQERGYITTIRNAWHILPYEQLLGVLGWSAEQLAVALKEDDFLGIKLGSFKPDCEPIREEKLTPSQEKQLAVIKNVMQSEFSGMFTGAKPFSFFEEQVHIPEKSENVASEGLRMIYSYCGLFAKVLDDDITISYPEELLKMYQAAGINAIWLPGILYQLTPFPFDESYSIGWEKRQERLRELIVLAAKYDIKVYMYLNEPRAMPLQFFEKYPEMQGATGEMYASLCLGDERVLRYVKDAVSALCKAVPGLGGFILINMSENLTHCKSVPWDIEKECERCKDTPTQKLVSDVVCTITEAVQETDPSIQIIVWTWAWSLMADEEQFDCLDRMPKDVIIQTNSEYRKKFCVGGVENEVREYSISIPGPSEFSKGILKRAKANGHETCAKVQVNVTWECSTVPFLPVFDLIREHMKGLSQEGVRHMMLSWTLGGYPSINLKIAIGCLNDPSEEKYDDLLAKEYGEYAPAVKKAASIFSEAFREFPYGVGTVYNGPQNGGPSNLLFEENTGFEATMTCYSYDDIDKWRKNYPREVFRDQFLKVSTKWEEGLELIRDMPACDFKHAAYGGYALFYSSYLQTDFIMSREDKSNLEKIQNILSEERKMALLMYELMRENSLMGYEAANHYYFNKGMLAEKVLCCDYLKERFKK